jgi:hypothetical protein
MGARLYSGIKSLHLVLDTPYDTIRTDDIRDDLIGVRVWYSKTSGFNPLAGQGTLAFNGAGLSITVSDLETNTRYYVKYAFISSIDPDIYTVSAELTALVYDENTTVYGYLTNDPLPIATAADGSGGDFSLATGVFKVFNLSQEVTGNGPAYSIKPGSNNYVVGAVINAVTGVYSCTGISENAANITFVAEYNGVIVEQVWNIYRGLAGEKAPVIRLSATNSSFVFKDVDATLPLTANTVITAQLTNLTGTPVFTTRAFTRAGTPLGSGNTQVNFEQVGNVITITGAQFGALGVMLGTVIVTATLGDVSDSFTLYRINDGTEQITVELTNSAHVIAAANNGDTVPANYVGSGTIIRVKQGNTYLNVDPASPYDSLGTWNIFNITSVNITADPTPIIATNYIDFDTHAAMTADQAYIDYTINYRTTTGKTGTQVVRQSFAKSKEGVIGATARTVSITAQSQAFITPKNASQSTVNSIVLTAVASNFQSPTYTWLVDGVAPVPNTGTASGSTFTLNSFAPVGSRAVTVIVTETIEGQTYSVYDIFSVYSLREGDDSLVVGLSNENQTISCDSAGEPIAGQFPIQSKLYAILGTTILTSSSQPPVTFAKVSYTGGASNSYSINSSGDISIFSINADAAEAVFSATVRGTTVNKVLSLSKARAGQRGQTGEGVSQIYIRSDLQPNTPNPSDTVPSGWSPTVAGATGTAALWTSFGTRLVGSTTYTWQVPTRVQGEAGNPLRNASGFLYFSTPQASAPGTPSASGFNFATGNFSTVTSGWATTFNVPSGTTTALWAVRYSVQETVFGGAQTVSISTAFTHQNFNGLVTFTNDYITANDATTIANSRVNAAAPNYANKDLTNVTTIDGGLITTGTIDARRLNIGKVRTGDYIRMFDNQIIVYTGNSPRVIIGNLTPPVNPNT